VTGCSRQHHLNGSEWLTVKFSIDSSNYLSELDKSVYSNFDTSKKLYIKFTDSLAFAFVEGAPVDTSIYKLNNDTLYFIHDSYKDTSIILKLTKDSLIEQRLAGVKTYSIRFGK
jgi:hypothetical protein